MFMVTTSNGVLGSFLAPVLALFGQTVDAKLADLSGWRVVTGLGIGGMLAAINAVASEFSNEKSRHLNVSLMSIGYPIGAVLGGLVAAQLLKTGDWRAVFYFGAAVTAVLIPVVFFAVPESVHWLTRKQPAGALQAVNRAMTRMGHATAAALPVISPEARAKSAGDIFGPAMLMTTALVTAAYFFHITTFYYLIKWVPKLVVDMGFAPSSAAGVLVWVNVGGATGGALFALLTQRFNLKTLTMGVLLLSTVTIIVFGRTPADLQRLIADLRARRLLHQRRHRRPLRHHRAGVSDARPRLGHRLRDRRRPRRIGARADHRRLPVHRGLLAAVGVVRDGRRLHAGRVHAAAAEARIRQARDRDREAADRALSTVVAAGLQTRLSEGVR